MKFLGKYMQIKKRDIGIAWKKAKMSKTCYLFLLPYFILIHHSMGVIARQSYIAERHQNQAVGEGTGITIVLQVNSKQYGMSRDFHNKMQTGNMLRRLMEQ